MGGSGVSLGIYRWDWWVKVRSTSPAHAVDLRASSYAGRLESEAAVSMVVVLLKS